MRWTDITQPFVYKVLARPLIGPCRSRGREHMYAFGKHGVGDDGADEPSCSVKPCRTPDAGHRLGEPSAAKREKPHARQGPWHGPIV